MNVYIIALGGGVNALSVHLTHPTITNVARIIPAIMQGNQNKMRNVSIRKKPDDPCFTVVIDQDVFEVIEPTQEIKYIGSIENADILSHVSVRARDIVETIPIWLMHKVVECIDIIDREYVSRVDSSKIEGPQDAISQGFQVDFTCYPHVAYKGERFQPRQTKKIFTELETKSLRLLRRFVLRENKLRKEVNFARRILRECGAE